MSREEKKMMAIMRQFEAMEKKNQKGSDPATPRGEREPEEPPPNPVVVLAKRTREPVDVPPEVGRSTKKVRPLEEAREAPASPACVSEVLSAAAGLAFASVGGTDSGASTPG
eukprot:CAMPEP_0180227020 /NCGR_PEP_ID=MMETSP0987-20121128/23869_1 /TAXON_ID=697907 /ORGANISM="non described non described, Strain CCMP2293" /LENGTH=111 /DNA_ID=CAMNT_0022190843 /DNA_START=42 /DNA_END=374 /DNA_ORIENTATION=-